MPERGLRLQLGAGEALPTSLNWRIEVGYLHLQTWDEHNTTTTLGIWGPGELVISSFFPDRPLQLCSLSAVAVQAQTVTTDDYQAGLTQQLDQLSLLLQLAHTRRAEERLLKLLIWLGQRFGHSSSQGVILSFSDMNLTHRNLASITGMTRVTITKALATFRREGRLSKQGKDELLRLVQAP